MIKLLNYTIKKNRANYHLFIENIQIGTLTYQNNEIIITLKDNKYQNIFFRMFANFLFKQNVKYVYFNNEKYTPKNFYYLRKYQTLLFDIDDTILDFTKSEQKALTEALESINVEVNSKMLADYHKINLSYWEKVERKEISRDECLIYRFKDFLSLYKINIDPNVFEVLYRDKLNTKAYVKKNAKKILKILQDKYQIYAITNGVRKTQLTRTKKAKIQGFFLNSFISDVIGYHKPDVRFYNYIKDHITNFNPKTTLIIGDSLTSDIKLGNNALIDTLWFNENFKENKSDIKPTYEINLLLELLYF